MSQIINIKLTKVGPVAGPFVIYDQLNNVIANNVSKQSLINGVTYTVSNSVTSIRINSLGDCTFSRTRVVAPIINTYYNNLIAQRLVTGCVWRHLTNIQLYNSFYGLTKPYVIEYPKDSSPNTEILQSISDYSKVYKYLSNNNYNSNDRIELDDKYFNKLIVYNNQQSSGMLELVAKPINNLHAYNKYPIYNTKSKTILYIKSDNFYKINSFWDIVKNKTETLFVSSCISSSIDKEINQDNMIYTNQAFKKYPLRAKDVKIRYILDNDDSIHIVSQFVLTFNQISYK
jgi:hypothetical protein